jgi:hypothetical protein
MHKNLRNEIMKSLIKSLIVSLTVAVSITALAEDILKDNTFSKESGWAFWVEKTAIDAGGSLTFQDGKAVVKSPALEKQDAWKIQIMKTVDIDADKSCKIKFKANTDKAGKIIVAYCLAKAPHTTYENVKVALEPGEKEYDCILPMKKLYDGKYDTPRQLRFWLAGFKDATVTLSNISVEEVK